MPPPNSNQPPDPNAPPQPLALSPAEEQRLVDAALERLQRVLKGNGIKKENISVLSRKIVQFTINAGTYLELKPVTNERSMPGKAVVGEPRGSREEATRAVDQAMVGLVGNAAGKAQIANILLERPDQGFGLNHQALALDFLTREFSWQEACQTCRGTAQTPCQRCLGKRVEPCIKCSGRRLMFCPMCRGTGLLQGNKCPRCHAQRYVPCDGCRQSGMMNCRTCNATGAMKCNTCAGHGWKTHILSVHAQALTYFEYDGKSVPKPAADQIETRANALATSGQVKITGRMADDKENVLGANYEVGFPYGELVFQIGKKEVKGHLFGNDAELVDFPHVLDRILGPAVEELEEAANDMGSVADKIRSATRFRLIAQAYLAAIRMPPKKAIAALMKSYDIGLSPGMAERIVMLAERTETRITRKPRAYGLVAGLIAAAGMNAAYYLTPVRGIFTRFLPDQRFDFILDAPMPLLGGALTALFIKLFAAASIRKALGHILPKEQKNLLGAKTHASGAWAYAGAAIITLSLIETASILKAGSPYWYEIGRSLIRQYTGL